MDEVSTKIDFLGPTKMKFNSFESQAAYFLDTFCQDWRNYENPGSHLIPRIFDYKSAEIDDEVVDQVQNSLNSTSSQKRLMTERISDQAEHIMYRAINQLISEKVVGPFIAIHNLNIDQRRINILKQIYPSIDWKTAEYDFLLVGEKIGLIVIEVKSSHFHRRNDFARRTTHLPALFKKATDQLGRVEEFLKNVCECTGGKLSPFESHLRKILFAPNLERSRFEAWKSNLPACHMSVLNSKIDGLQLLFKEDTQIDTQNPLPSVYQALKNLILGFRSGIPGESYETYVKIFIGISSIISFPGNHHVISTDPSAFSQSMAIAKESDRIRNQQPSNGKRSANSELISVSKLQGNHHLKSLSIFLLTPEQQNALKGGNRQVLIGPAGTGKTILIQAKAMELLSFGEPVIIFSTNYYRVKHKEIFDANGLTNYEIHHWPSFVAKAKQSMHGYWDPSINIHERRKFEMAAQEIYGNGSYQETIFENPLYRFLKSELSKKHLFFDDSMIVCNDRGSWSLFLACLAILKHSKSTIWIAADLYGSSTETMLSPEEYLTILGENFKFTLRFLGRVMRSSEEIYRLVHSQKYHDWDSLAYRFGLIGKNQMLSMSRLGHKVQGIPPRLFRKHFSTEAEAFRNLEQEFPPILQNFINHDLPGDNFLGIIMSVEHPSMWKKVIQNIARRHGEHINIGSLTSIVSNNYYNVHVVSDAMTSEYRLQLSRDHITIASGRCVLSFEWPVVLHILVRPKHLEESNETRFFQYQARSRAITTFFEFFYTFDVA